MSRSSGSGFLLFEAMISVCVLAVGLMLVLRSFNTAVMAVKGLQDYTSAMFLMEEKMFQLEQEGIEETGRTGEFGEGSACLTANRKRFLWRIDSVPAEGVSLDRVNIAVMWDTANSTRTFSAQTYLESKKAARAVD